MSWGQPERCTCKWEGDDHYNGLVAYDFECPVHDRVYHARMKEAKERNDLRLKVLHIEERKMYARINAMSREELEKIYAENPDTTYAKRVHR